MNIPNINWLRANTVLEFLHLKGVRHVVISPGSRNTPLSHSVVIRPEFDSIVALDERSAAFFALGIAKQSRQPVVLICTSGTAVANYLPAVVEAFQSRIPLIMLTADRPSKLRDRGAPQTIRQDNIFGKYSNYLELSEEFDNEASIASFIDLLNQYYSQTVSDNFTPLHINCPFDEPLRPVEQNLRSVQDLWKFVSGNLKQLPMSVHKSKRSSKRETRNIIEKNIESGSVAIVAGPESCQHISDRESLEKISSILNAPIFADITSGVRQKKFSLNFPDIIPGSVKFEDLIPDVIIWVGEYPTSKRMAKLLLSRSMVIRIQPYDKCIDPDGIVSKTLYITLKEFEEQLIHKTQNIWQQNYRDNIDKRDKLITDKVHILTSEQQLPDEILSIKNIVKRLPENSNIMLSNSMAVRFADMFCVFRPDLNVFGNKGANGIDGIISTAAGLSYASGKATFLISGDLTFVHDLNALYLVKKYNLDMTILLINNNGGGIFHYLPAYQEIKSFDKFNATKLDTFEKIFELGIDLQLEKICDSFGMEYFSVANNTIIPKNLDFSKQQLFELKVEREHSHSTIKNAFKDIADL